MLDVERPLYVASVRLAEIRDTELGQTLLTRPRYGHFRPADMPVDDWLELFDDDVNNFEHNGLTAYLADIVTTIDEVTPEVRAAVIMTASIHDLPEDVSGSESGDKQYNLSGREEERLERARLRQLARDPDFPLTEAEVELAISIMNDSKTEPPTTEEGFLFNVVERIGYVRTALIAWDLLEDNKISFAYRPNIEWMIGNIVGNHIPYLQSISHLSRSVSLQLETNVHKLNSIITTLERPVVQQDIRNICSITGRGKDKIDPDVQMNAINQCIESWRAAS